jgi:hypothetical protein
VDGFGRLDRASRCSGVRLPEEGVFACSPSAEGEVVPGTGALVPSAAPVAAGPSEEEAAAAPAAALFFFAIQGGLNGVTVNKIKNRKQASERATHTHTAKQEHGSATTKDTKAQPRQRGRQQREQGRTVHGRYGFIGTREPCESGAK